MAWAPGDPWPSSTAGGVAHPAWGGYIRFWLLADIAAGRPFRLGADANDRLNAGNVLTQAASMAAGEVEAEGRAGFPTAAGLWVDLSCDLTDCEIRFGAGTAAGVLSKVEASTLTATLYDPTGKYDPANPTSPYSLSGRSRLVPGRWVYAFAEVVTDPAGVPPAVSTFTLFAGTADLWTEGWDKEPSDRRAKLTATDFTKRLVKLDRDEQPPVGAGDTVAGRLSRILGYFGVSSTPSGWVAPGEPSRTLQATTLAQSCWELLNRTIDDELGELWVQPSPILASPPLIWTSRGIWSYKPAAPPPLQLGCGGPGYYDILTGASPEAFDATLVNAAYAARSGGTTQTYRNTPSVNAYGEHSINRTDLGLADDPQVAGWATDLVNLSAYPRSAIDQVTMQPGIVRAPQSNPGCWSAVLTKMGQPVLGLTSIVYANPNFGYTVSALVRMVGYTHRLDTDAWEIEWRTVAADLGAAAQTFHTGTHANDRVDAGNVLAA